MDTEVHIRPINSRGDLTRARIVIDKSVLDDVIVALMKMRDRMAADVDLPAKPLALRDFDAIARKHCILITDWLDAGILTALCPGIRQDDVPALLDHVSFCDYREAIDRNIVRKCITEAAERAGVSLHGRDPGSIDGAGELERPRDLITPQPPSWEHASLAGRVFSGNEEKPSCSG
jgi:hypothetical protein